LRLKNLAVAAAVLLVAGLAAIAAAVYYFDPRSLAASLAASVKADTGRELSVGGVSVTLLPRPALVLQEVRFGNAAWGSRPWLAQAGRASADIDLRALLSRRLRIERIEVSDASVFLETDAAGKGNWAVGMKGEGTPAWLESFQIDELTLDSLALAYRDGATGKTTSAQIESARIDVPAPAGPLKLRVRGTFAERQMEVTGTIGALTALLADTPAYAVDLEGKLGGANASLKGTIDNPRALGGLKLALRVEAGEFADLAALFGAAGPPRGPFSGTAQLSGPAAAPVLSAIDATLGGRGTPEIRLRGTVANPRAASGIDLKVAASAARWWRFGTAVSGPRLPPFRASARLRDAPQGYRLDDLELKIAESTVSASLQVVQRGPRLRITGKAAAPLIDLSRLAPEAATAPRTAAASPRAAGYWKLADLDLDLNIGRLVFAGGRELRSGSGRIAIEDGRLHAKGLQATFGGAKATFEGSVADPQNLAGLDLGIALQGGELADLFNFFEIPIRPVGPFQGRARMNGSLDALRLTEIDVQAGRSGQSVHASGHVEDVINRRGLQLAMTANISNSTAAGVLLGIELPRMPGLRATARLTDAPGGYAFEDLKLSMGRTSMQGRVAHARGEARPRITADLSGPLVDLSEWPRPQRKPGGTNPLLVADVDANIRFDRVVLPGRRALGPVSGDVRLAAGALEFKQFSVAVEGASATLDGRIGEPLKLAALDLTVAIKVAHGAGLGSFTGFGLQNLPTFTASGRLTDVPTGHALSGLTLAHPATTIAGELGVTRGPKRFKVTAKANSPLLDLRTLVQPAAPESAAKPKAAGARAIPDAPLPLDLLRAIDAEIDLRFDAVKFSETASLGPLLAHAALADGSLKADPVQLMVKAEQALRASATLDAAKNAIALRIQGKAIDFGDFIARLGRPGEVTGGSTDLEVQLQARGKTLGEVLETLNGNVRVTAGPHRVNNFAINLGRGLFTNMFALANPFQKSDPYTDVKCLAASLPVKNGVLTSERNIAIETTKYNVIASGTVNLRTERIELVLTPVVRGEAGTMVRVNGTLADPTAGLDVAGAARAAASFGASVAIPAWLIADSLIKKSVSDPTPCATALAR
jgi:uncharacterized protein involved in outer membrane biogenesis